MVLIEHSPPHESIDQLPLVISYFLAGHSLEFVRVVQMLAGLTTPVVHEIRVLGISIGQEVERFLFQSNEHACLKVTRTKFYDYHQNIFNNQHIFILQK